MSDGSLIDRADAGRMLALSAERIGKLERRGLLSAQCDSAGSTRFKRDEVHRLTSSCSHDMHHHAVQFFEDEGFLANVVGAFLAEGLRSQAPAVVIARPHRIAAFTQCLDDLDCAPGTAQASGQLLLLDAERTLSTFMINGMPSPERFRATLSPVVERMRAAHPAARLRAYGEMVDILWGRGQPEAAVRLEEIWNDFSREQPFSLLCAYSMSNFDSPEHGNLFDRVCETHSEVAPTEACEQGGVTDTYLREIVHLQHRIRVLERQLRAQVSAYTRLDAEYLRFTEAAAHRSAAVMAPAR